MTGISGVIPPADVRDRAPGGPSLRNRSGLRWGKFILLAFLCLWAAGEGISLLIQHSRLRGKLSERLEASFGRSVEVREYAFSFWDGPAIEARDVSVAENPLFGHEYFLRSESLSVRLRWQSLLRGHLELGTLSLDRPSLNLVRDASGDWNLAAWLPQPSGGKATGADRQPSALPTLRFHKIEVSGGRINFKQGDNKLPFAFVDVNGTIDTAAPGSWRLNLNANPWRAAAITQEAGTIHLSGRVGGTSSRLRPADFVISWTDASVSDVFRLLRGDDYGIRGAMSLSISARTDSRPPLGGWTFQGRAELRQLHRWDLPLRGDDPSVNIVVRTAQFDPRQASLAVPDVLIEAPHSSAHAGGAYSWAASQGVAHGGNANTENNWTASSAIDLRDVLAWIRAFHPGLDNGLSILGRLETHMDFSGWPPRLVSASANGPGAKIVFPGLPEPASVGPIDFHYGREGAILRPVAVRWGSSSQPGGNLLEIEAPKRSSGGVYPAWHVIGEMDDAEGIITAGRMFGGNFSGNWQLRGPLDCDLRWQGVAAFPWQAPPVGTIDIGAPTKGKEQGATLQLAFLNLPIEQLRAHAELNASARHVTLIAAQAAGGHWSGTISRRPAQSEWHFDLSLDRLSASSLDRWLNPRWRESFLGRMLPFLGAKPVDAAMPDSLRASGSLELGQFTLTPLVASRVKANIIVEGRRIALAEAAGQFYGGNISGAFRADLDHPPGYHANLSFSSVHLASLAESSPSLAGLFSGNASGELSMDAQGAAREDLLGSLACRGNVHITDGEWRDGNVSKLLAGQAPSAESPGPLDGSAAFTCGRRRIDFQSLALQATGTRAHGKGSVDFNRTLDLRLEVSDSAGARDGAHDASYRIRGPLSAPKIEPLSRPRRSP